MDERDVEQVKRDLYSRSKQGPLRDIRSPLSKHDSEVPVAWEGGVPRTHQPPPPHRPRMAFATKFLIGSALFFVIAAIGAGLYFFTGGNFISSQNIDLQII